MRFNLLVGALFASAMLRARVFSTDVVRAPRFLTVTRNWQRLQAGKFKSDPTFPEFVAQVQTAKRQKMSMVR